MKTKACVALVGVAAGLFAGLALGQDTTMSYSITWDKPTIENGQTNTGAVWVTIAPGIGSSVQWTTPPGKGQPGTIEAFASSVFDTMNLLNGSNGQLSWTVPTEFNVAGLPGTPDGNGGISGTSAGQLSGGGGINPNPNVSNPVKLLNLQWKAEAAGAYDVNYGLKSLTGKMFLNIGISNWVGHNATFRVDGQGGFSVIPVPSAAAAFGFGVLILGRRTRSSTAVP